MYFQSFEAIILLTMKYWQYGFCMSMQMTTFEINLKILVTNIPLNYHSILDSSCHYCFLLQAHVSSFPKQQYQHSTLSLKCIEMNEYMCNCNKIIRLLGQFGSTL